MSKEEQMKAFSLFYTEKGDCRNAGCSKAMMIKSLAIFAAAAILSLAAAFASYASCEWDDGNGGIKATWDAVDTNCKLRLYKGEAIPQNEVGSAQSVSAGTDSKNLIQSIINGGPGSYRFTVTDSQGNVIEASELLQISNEYHERLMNGYTQPEWKYLNGYWYLVDAVGNKLTGWHEVSGKWYYMSTESGKCFIDRMTPDGFYVDKTGAWDGKYPS